ncbi:MAG: hypothetical protein AAB618_02085, partial [Patescibacteria group bacterium]
SGDVTRAQYGEDIQSLTDGGYVQVLDTPKTLAEQAPTLQIFSPAELPQGKSSTEAIVEIILTK